jgi:AcrR family transcriptional regulator
MNSATAARQTPAHNQQGQAMGAKGLQTRRSLLDATQALLETVPLRQLRVAQIVRRARTSTSTFYIYFADVPEAVLALLEEATQSPPNLLSMLASPWPPGGDLDRAQAFVTAYIENWQSNAALFRVRNLASDEGDARFVAHRIEAVAPLIEAMAQRVEARRGQGGLPPDLQPHSAAGALLSLIERISGRWMAPSSRGVTGAELADVAVFLTALAIGEGDVRAAPWPAKTPSDAGTPARTDHAAVGVPRFLNKQGQVIGPKGARTRGRIMEATAGLLGAKALRDCSVADIAKAAGMSSATFYLYFEDVADVVLALVAEAPQATSPLLDILEGIAAGGDVDALSRQFVELYARQWLEHAAVYRVRNLAGDEGDDRFVLARARSVQPLMDAVAGLTSAAQASGRLPARLHPLAVAAALVAMLERTSGSHNVRVGGPVRTPTLNRAAAYFVSVLLGGPSR